MFLAALQIVASSRRGVVKRMVGQTLAYSDTTEQSVKQKELPHVAKRVVLREVQKRAPATRGDRRCKRWFCPEAVAGNGEEAPTWPPSAGPAVFPP